jgi:hypothetical protein
MVLELQESRRQAGSFAEVLSQLYRNINTNNTHSLSFSLPTHQHIHTYFLSTHSFPLSTSAFPSTHHHPHRLRTHADELRELLEKERKRADSAQERLSLYDQNFLQLHVGAGGVRVPGMAGGIGIVPYLVTKGAIFEPHMEGDAAGEVLILIFANSTPPTHIHTYTKTPYCCL